MKSNRSYLGAGVPSILITLIILLISCFAALTFISANSEMKLSEKSAAYCDNYYAAETTAVEILLNISNNAFSIKSAITADKNGNLVYNDIRGDVVIFKNDSNITFAVPINKKQVLDVSAQVTGSDIDIVSWSVK